MKTEVKDAVTARVEREAQRLYQEDKPHWLRVGRPFPEWAALHEKTKNLYRQDALDGLRDQHRAELEAA